MKEKMLKVIKNYIQHTAWNKVGKTGGFLKWTDKGDMMLDMYHNQWFGAMLCTKKSYSYLFIVVDIVTKCTPPDLSHQRTLCRNWRDRYKVSVAHGAWLHRGYLRSKESGNLQIEIINHNAYHTCTEGLGSRLRTGREHRGWCERTRRPNIRLRRQENPYRHRSLFRKSRINKA